MDRNDQKNLLDALIEDELRGIWTYDELLEIMPEDADVIKKIMEQEAIHAIELRELQIKKNFGESKVWQDIEDMLGILELKHGIKEGMPVLEKMITKTA